MIPLAVMLIVSFGHPCKEEKFRVPALGVPEHGDAELMVNSNWEGDLK